MNAIHNDPANSSDRGHKRNTRRTCRLLRRADQFSAFFLILSAILTLIPVTTWPLTAMRLAVTAVIVALIVAWIVRVVHSIYLARNP